MSFKMILNGMRAMHSVTKSAICGLIDMDQCQADHEGMHQFA